MAVVLGTGIERWAGAAVVLLLYLGLCAVVVWRHRAMRAQAHDERRRLGAGQSSTPAEVVWVVHASQTGRAEALARETAHHLHAAGVAVQWQALGELTVEALSRASRVLFVASTCGEGDAPDNAVRFEPVLAVPAHLNGLQVGVLALGDRSYRHFCGFGRRLDTWLQASGARALFPRVDLDGDDRVGLQQWQAALSSLTGTTDAVAWQGLPTVDWRLLSRRCLNEGSSGAPCFELVLQPPAPMTWQAGDLLQVCVPDDPGHPRDYTIASLCEEGGTVSLIVRQARRDDGQLGVASGWLTQTLPLLGEVQAAVREHRAFHIAGNAARPLLLIGNGTGIAGLRAHLAARAAHPLAPVWLLYGERHAAHDRPCAEELAAWHDAGVIERLDLVYSRDSAEPRYVQHVLRASAATLQAWVQAGAAIYVCGSRQGMAQAIDAVLVDVLGADTVNSLVDAGRLKRDVY